MSTKVTIRQWDFTQRFYAHLYSDCFSTGLRMLKICYEGGFLRFEIYIRIRKEKEEKYKEEEKQ